MSKLGCLKHLYSKNYELSEKDIEECMEVSSVASQVKVISFDSETFAHEATAGKWFRLCFQLIDQVMYNVYIY